jgi:hypothetical protein
MQFGLAALASGATSAFPQGTARPMANAMLITAVLAMICLAIEPPRS